MSRTPPKYSSGSLGLCERTHLTLAGQERTMRLEVESIYGKQLLPSHVLWPWLVRHASWLVARFHVRSNGRTAYRDVHDVDYKSAIIPFGETILYRISMPANRRLPRGRRYHKADSAWVRGLFVGKTEESD
eukprot:15021909-Alexandrium_andersonii.AAC.1